MDSYMVIKFFKDGNQEIVADNLTKDEAKEYCQGEDSSGENWFYGFTKE